AGPLVEEEVAEGVDLSLGLDEDLVAELDRLPPVRAEEEHQRNLSPPGVEDVAQRHVVAERLRHLLAAQPADHSVVHPDARELVTEGERLRDLVLVVREDEVEAAAVDLEDRPERVLGHHRALDVPTRPTAAPGRVPGGVLTGLVRLPQREIPSVLLERI